MVIFSGPKHKFWQKKTWFAPKILSDIRSAAGELFIGPSQSLPEMSDGHWGTLQVWYLIVSIPDLCNLITLVNGQCSMAWNMEL